MHILQCIDILDTMQYDLQSCLLNGLGMIKNDYNALISGAHAVVEFVRNLS